jgi:hypothetical protein
MGIVPTILGETVREHVRQRTKGYGRHGWVGKDCGCEGREWTRLFDVLDCLGKIPSLEWWDVLSETNSGANARMRSSSDMRLG